MNVGLMLSWHEAFGRVTVEYMMHRICVIATNTSANPEIISDGDNGVLYPIDSPEILAIKIKELYNDRQCVVRYSEKGWEDAMTKYLSVTNSSRVYEIYKLLVQ